MSPLLAFYLGSHPDDRGRMLAEILRQDALWLELTHDYIQWLFPLPEPSRVNKDAPLVDAATSTLFRQDALLRRHLMASYLRMLSFYGLKRDADGALCCLAWLSTYRGIPAPALDMPINSRHCAPGP